MTEPFEIVIRDARTRERPETRVNIAIRDGTLAAITTDPVSGHTELEAEGNLVTPAFVDAQLHLCKVYTLPMVGEEAQLRYRQSGMGEAMGAIELAAQVKAQYDETWIYRNVRRALLDGLKHGVTHVQAFVDTDTRARLEGIKAVLRAKRDLDGVVDVRVVAFPQDGILRDPGAEDYLRQALTLGADVVGGIPWIEYTDADAQEHVDRVFRLAQDFNRNVAMLVDDTGDPGLRTTEMLAVAAIRTGWVDRITACHARAMSMYPEPYFRRLVRLAQQAGVTFVTDPHTGPLHLRAFDLLESGLTVALGQDDIADAYYPYGQHNMVEVAFLASHLLAATTLRQMELLFDMITTHGARVLRLPDYGLAVGRAAHLVVLADESTHDVITRHQAPRYVISHGRLVSETTRSTLLHGVEP